MTKSLIIPTKEFKRNFYYSEELFTLLNGKPYDRKQKIDFIALDDCSILQLAEHFAKFPGLSHPLMAFSAFLAEDLFQCVEKWLEYDADDKLIITSYAQSRIYLGLTTVAIDNFNEYLEDIKYPALGLLYRLRGTKFEEDYNNHILDDADIYNISAYFLDAAEQLLTIILLRKNDFDCTQQMLFVVKVLQIVKTLGKRLDLFYKRKTLKSSI